MKPLDERPGTLVWVLSLLNYGKLIAAVAALKASALMATVAAAPLKLRRNPFCSCQLNARPMRIFSRGLNELL